MQMDACRYLHLGPAMPARAVAHQEDPLAAVRAPSLGELAQRHREGRNGDGRQQQPHGAPRGWGHQGIEVAPRIALRNDRLRTWAAAAPAPPQDGLEPDAVLIHRPPRYRVLWVGGLERLDRAGHRFFTAAWAPGAALAWRGRGTFGRQPRRWSMAQPRWGWTAWPRVVAIQAATFGPVHIPPSGGGGQVR